MLALLFEQPGDLEVHRVGPVPVTAPREPPSLEDPDGAGVDLPAGAALVSRHVEVEGDPPCMQRDPVARVPTDKPWNVAAAVLVRVDRVREPAPGDSRSAPLSWGNIRRWQVT